MPRSKNKQRAPLPKTCHVTVADVHVHYRTVKFAPRCPKCSADLTAPGAVNAWEYGVQMRTGAIMPTDGPIRELGAEAGFETDGHDDCESGNGFISYTSYNCARCCTLLASGTESESTEAA